MMDKIKIDKELTLSNFLYMQTKDGQKIFGDKITIYENCGIIIYKGDNIVSCIECTEIEVKKWEEDIFIFAKNLIPFSISVIYEECSKMFKNESFKLEDKVIRQDNLNSTKLEFAYISGVELDIEQIKQQYEYTVVEINIISDDFKVVTIQKGDEIVQTLETELISLPQIFKNANILIDIGKTRLPFQIE